MKKFMDKLYIKALVGAGKAKNELQKMREEDEGLDIIITIILVAVGLVLVGVIAKYGTKALNDADAANAGANSALNSLQETAGKGVGNGLGGGQ